MKYFAARFHLDGESLSAETRQMGHDLIAALAAEAGFESFEEEAEQLVGYARTDLFDEAILASILGDFPLPGVKVSYEIAEAEDKDWNAKWEEAGFEPIMIGDRCVIHDTKHEVDTTGKTDILIDARMAFGTGTHETTRLMVGELLDANLTGKRVLDCGCGTGILSIAAAKCGAASVVAYDIDEWSVENTRHNARLNHVDQIEVNLGDVRVLKEMKGDFDFILANINRNILLSDMASMCAVLAPGGHLIISGFYEDDVAVLRKRAEELGLRFHKGSSSGAWNMLSFCS